MSEIIDFIKENVIKIVIIVVLVLLLLVLINIKGINLNAPKPEPKLIQQVTVEALATMDSEENIIASPKDNFCQSYLGNSFELEKACNELTEGNCADVKCCIYGNGKCVAGNINGPTYKTDKDGKLITMDSYYYLGKCQGRCPT